jgi:acetylornithine deacetylase/succinyl-diaminopimelate desuccinylase-like protein
MTDLIYLMSTLVEPGTGKILIPGVMDDVAPVTEEEDALYDSIDFDIDSYKNEATVQSVSDRLLYHEKKSLLMARWRYPTLSLHGIEGAFANKGAKTVIPSKVKGKFSLRLVPNQNPERIAKVVEQHLTLQFEKVSLNVPADSFVLIDHFIKITFVYVYTDEITQ